MNLERSTGPAGEESSQTGAEKTTADLIEEERAATAAELTSLTGPHQGALQITKTPAAAEALRVAEQAAEPMEAAQRIMKDSSLIMEKFNLDPEARPQDLTRLSSLMEALNYCRMIIGGKLAETAEAEPITKTQRRQIMEKCTAQLLLKPDYFEAFADELLAIVSSEDIEALRKPQARLFALLEKVTASVIPDAPPLARIAPPDKFSILTSKLVNSLTGIEAGKETPIKESTHGGAGFFETFITLSYTQDSDLKFTRPLEEIDLVTYEAICSLYTAAKAAGAPPVITSSAIFRAMTGKTGSSNVKPEQAARVTASIEKMMQTAIYMDCTQEVNRYKESRLTEFAPIQAEAGTGGAVKRARRIEQLLSCRGLELTAKNGAREWGWIIKDEPVLLEYSRRKGRNNGQIQAIPAARMAAGEISSTEDAIVLRRYINFRIEGMRRQGNAIKSNRITYAAAFEKIGLPATGGTATEVTKRKRTRKTIAAILDGLQEMGAIKSYKEYTTGRAITGIEISL